MNQLLLFAFAGLHFATFAAERPNFLIILADDTHKTPQIDKDSDPKPL